MDDFEIRGTSLVRYRGSDPWPELPEGITEIADGAFKDCRDLCEIVIPEGVMRIGAEAFQWCANLESVKAPASLVETGPDAFAGTPFYRYYDTNETDWRDDFLILGRVLFKARRLGWHCFKGCGRLAEVSFDEGVEEIENGIFASCRSIRYVNFPASLKKFPGWAFFGSNNVERVGFSGPIASMGERAFSGCENLRSVDFPAGLRKIGVDAFYSCICLESAMLPEGLSTIERRAFAGCRCIERAVIPETVTTLGDSVFSGCRLLREHHAGHRPARAGGRASRSARGVPGKAEPHLSHPAGERGARWGLRLCLLPGAQGDSPARGSGFAGAGAI